MENRIEKQMELAAPVSRVWQAPTDSRQFGQWFGVQMEGPFIAGEPVTGRITVTGYENLLMDLVVQAIEPETLFSYTWHPYAVDPKVEYSRETPTLVEFRLKPTERGTLLQVTETGFENLPTERYTDAFRMNNRGWEQQMRQIQQYVGESA